MATTVSSLEHKTNVEFNNLRLKLQNQLKKDIFREIYYDSEIKSKEDELLKCIESAFTVDKPLSLEASSDFELSNYFSVNDSFIAASTPKLHLLKEISKSSSCVFSQHLRNSDNTVYYSLVDESLVLSDYSDINEEPARPMNGHNRLTESTSSEMNVSSRESTVDGAAASKCAAQTSEPQTVVEHLQLGDLLEKHEPQKATTKFFSSDGNEQNSGQSIRVRKFFIDASDLIDEDAANGEKAPDGGSRSSPQSGAQNEEGESCTVVLRHTNVSKSEWVEPAVETSCKVVLRSERQASESNVTIEPTEAKVPADRQHQAFESSVDLSKVESACQNENRVESVEPIATCQKYQASESSISVSVESRNENGVKSVEPKALSEKQVPESSKNASKVESRYQNENRVESVVPKSPSEKHLAPESSRSVPKVESRHENRVEPDTIIRNEQHQVSETCKTVSQVESRCSSENYLQETSCNVVLRQEKQQDIPESTIPGVYLSKAQYSNLRQEICEKQTPDSLDDDPHLSTECNHTAAELQTKLENDFFRASVTAAEVIPSSGNPIPAQRSCDQIVGQRSCDQIGVQSCDVIPVQRNCDPIPAQKSCDAIAQRSCDLIPAQRSCANHAIPAISFDIFKTYLIEKYDCARKNHAYSDDELQRLKVFDELISQDTGFAYLRDDLREVLATGAPKMRIAMHKFLVKQYEKHHKTTYASAKEILKMFLKQRDGSQKFDRDSLNDERLGDDTAEVDELFKRLLKVTEKQPKEPAEAVTSRSFGFFIDLKESPKPTAKTPEKSIPAKQLFSMFIDFGNSTDSDSSLEAQNRFEKRKKQYISKMEKSRELRNSVTSLNEEVATGGRKLEKIVQSTPLSCSLTSDKSTEEVKPVDTSTVVLRRSKNTNGTPHPNASRRSWNVDKTNEVNQNTITKHKRSYSVSARQYEAASDELYAVDINLNRAEGAADFPSIGNADSRNELTVNGESELSNSHSYSEGGDARTQSSVSNSNSAKTCNGGLPKSEEICSKTKEKVFVKLSDMDKEPKTLSSTDHWSSVRMTKSAIGTEASWFETKLLNGSVNSRSLSRIFPDLSASVLSKPNSDVDDTTVSSISSVQSSSAVSTCESNLELSNNASKCDNNTLGQDLLKMFLDEISTDVVVEVAGRRIKAHKCILTSRCQYFAALLSGGWVESAGNVLSIHGFSFNVVHFALCYIYSGESEIPENISIVELASLADYLCLEGLKEVVSCTLKMRYCHFFHKPCNICSVGVLECLPIALNYGLDDIHRRSLRWITKHYVRLWCSKAFATLPRELIDKCYNQHVVNMTVNNVFETLTNCDKLFTLIPQTRWAEPCFVVTRKLHDFCIKFLANHFVEFLKSDAFLSIATNRTWGIIIMDEKTQLACSKMRSDQLCQSYAYISGQCKLAMASHENEELIELLNRVKHQIETALVKIALQACQCTAWFQMEPELRSHIQTSAGLTFVPSEVKRRVETFKQRPPTISSGSRSVDLQQVKTAINRQHRQANNARPHELRPGKQAINQQKSSSHHGRSTSARQNGSQNKENKGGGTKASSHANSKSPFRNKYANVKSRYMEHKSGKSERATASETTPSETSEAERRPAGAAKRSSKSLASSVHLSPGASMRQSARAVSLSKIPVSVRTSSQKRSGESDTTSGSDNGARQERRGAAACANGDAKEAGGRRPTSSRGAAVSRAPPPMRKSQSGADAEPRPRSTRAQSAATAGRRKANGAARPGAGRRKDAARSKDGSPDAAKRPSNPSCGKAGVSEEPARPDVPFRRDGTFCIDEPTVLPKHSPGAEQPDVVVNSRVSRQSTETRKLALAEQIRQPSGMA